MNLLIRTDSSIGQGHVSRCKALGEAWRGKGIPSDWPEGLAFTIDPGSWFVFDGYDFTEKDHKETRDAGYRVLVIDDNAHLSRYDCDILVNHNAHAKSLKYNTGDDCKLLLGPEYALIRREFHDWRDKREAHESNRVLVALGSAVTDEIKLMVKSVLNSIECESRWAEGDAHMPSLMAWADVGIIAAGVSSLEACYMGLPSVLLVTAENQRLNACALLAQGLAMQALVAGESLSQVTLRNAVGYLLGDERERQRISKRCREAIDDNGAEKVVQVMLDR